MLADLDVAQDFLPRRLIDQRPHLDALVEAVADFDFPRAFDQHLGNVFRHVAMDDQSAGRRAALPGRAERAPERAFDGKIEIGIFHDDLRIFAAELQGNAFEILAAHRSDLAPDCRGTGERNQLNVAMAHQRGADFFAAAMNQIDHAGRNAGFGQNLDEPYGRVRRIFRRF